MKRTQKKLKLSLQLMVVVCAIVILGNGCSFTKSMMSKGRSSYNLAQEELSKGEYRKAIKFAADAVDIDPKIPRFQKFIYENFPKMEDATNSFLRSSRNTKVIAEAEKRYVVFSELVDMYNILGRLKFPLKDKKKGEWEFSTEIKDYSKDVIESRQYAYDLIIKIGKEDVLAEKLKDAHSKFKKAYGTYTTTENKENSAKDISASFIKHCNKYKKSNNIDKLITVHEAYTYVLYYTPFMKEASDGAKLMKTTISDLYYSQATKLFASKKIDNKIKSIESYKNALKWNALNAKAERDLKIAKEKLAEYYYAKALAMSKSPKSDRNKVIGLYREAQKWVANYKDSMYRIYSIKVNQELKTLRANLAKTRREYNRLSKRINPLSNSVNKCNSAMNSLTWVSDQTRDLNGKMKEISSTLKTFNAIPTVGTVTNFTSRALDKSRNPVNKLVVKFNKIERPMITPTKTAVGKIKMTVDRIKGVMSTTGEVITKTEKTVAEVDKCIMNLKLEDEFKRVEAAVKEMNKGVKGTATELARVNRAMDTFEGGVKQVAKVADPINKIKKGIKKVKPVLDKITGVTSKLNKVLKKSVKIGAGPLKVEASIHKVLTSASKVLKPLMGLVNKALNPVLKKLKIGIPPLPGVKDLQNKIRSVEQQYAKIKAESEKLTDAYKKYTDYERILKTQVNKVIETTGCGVKIGAKPVTAKGN